MCKRNANPREIVRVLRAIREVRPDLKLHGFGVKQTALADGYIRANFATCDSMAWNMAARRAKINGHNWHLAAAYAEKIRSQRVSAIRPFQRELF